MGLDRFNCEGYYDPTAYEALAEVAKERWENRKPSIFRPLVYICCPFSGDEEKNICRARLYSRFAVEKNAIPFSPILLLPQYMDEKSERSLAMKMDIIFLGKCAEVWVFGSRISNGMAYEIDVAKKQHKPIRYFTEDLKEAKRQ